MVLMLGGVLGLNVLVVDVLLGVCCACLFLSIPAPPTRPWYLLAEYFVKAE